MISRTIAVVLASAGLFAQQKAATPTPSAGIEFPVILQQKIVAGQTPIGTRAAAKLAVATLVNGVVIPEGAILSGEVTESEAKSATGPSRLAIRINSAKWKNGSASIKAYLTAWYYPAVMQNQDLSSGMPDAASSPTLRTGGAFPGARNPNSAPSPISDRDTGGRPPHLAPGISEHRVWMKKVESTCSGDGAITLTSQHSNLKFDKQTTYVFTGDCLLLPAK